MLSMADAKRQAIRGLARQPIGIADGTGQLDKLAREIYETERRLAAERGEDTIAFDELFAPKPKPRTWKTRVLAGADGRYIWFAPKRKRYIYHNDLGRLMGVVDRWGGRIVLVELGQVWPTPDSCPNDPRRTSLTYRPNAFTLNENGPIKTGVDKNNTNKRLGKWAEKMVVRHSPVRGSVRSKKIEKPTPINVTIGNQKLIVRIPYIDNSPQMIEYTVTHPKPVDVWRVWLWREDTTDEFDTDWSEGIEETPPIEKTPQIRKEWSMVGRTRRGVPVYAIV